MTEPSPPSASSPSPASPSPANPSVSKASPSWTGRRWLIAFVVIGLIVLVGLALTLPGYFEARTDDAYVEADVVTVAPKVGGYVTRLDVDDNSRFEAGQELLQIDDRDYRNAVASAEADLQNAEAARSHAAALLARQSSVIAAAQAVLVGDRVQMTFAHQQVSRYGPLAQGGYGSAEHLQQVQTDDNQRRSTFARDTADLKSANADLVALRAELQQADAEVAGRTAALTQARLNLSYTRIAADFDGSVANRIVRVGAFVQPGQALLSEVPARPYVIANYKETQLARMSVGQAVSVSVDAFPNEAFHAHIDSFQRGTGSRFALLPPENSTGNFVKVVQRVPVKIVFDEPAERLTRMAPGMSVETRVSFQSGGDAKSSHHP
jgi:membrane fusion protein, multidrug efflux system